MGRPINRLIVAYYSVFTWFSQKEQPRLPKGPAVLKASARRERAIERDFDALRLRLIAAEPPDANRNDALVYIMTSRTPGEGVSTVSAGLARSFIRHGTDKVLLLEANGKPNGHAATSSAAKGTGPAGWGAAEKSPRANTEGEAAGPGEVNYDAAIEQVEDGGPDTLPLSAMNGRQEPSGPPWEDYFSGLRARYDVIVVDAGALDSKTPYYWSKKANHVLLVVDATRTTAEALERLRKDLKTAKLDITGVVLNKRQYPIPKLFY